MIKAGKFFLNAYLLVAIVNMYCVAASIEQMGAITKYLLMPMLAMHVILNTGKQIKIAFTLIAAILFSWFGDIFLMYIDRNESYFLFGLGAFLIAHLFYLFTFRKYRYAEQSSKSQIFWALIPVAYSAGLIIWLYNGLGDMKVPVILYAVVITLMLITAIMRMGRTNSYSFLFVLIGAICFVISDSLIAVSKFGSPVSNAPILIMATYIIAQYLIVTGSLLHIKEE